MMISKNELIKKIIKLKKSPLKEIVDNKLREFNSLKNKGSREWFSELCFCLLTANTSAELGLRVQEELGFEGFTNNKSEEELALKLKKAGYRFYNKRANYIFLANKFKNDLKEIILSTNNKRDWLVNNIKGLGFKESSHFLRNVGFLDYAILDKHILRLLADHGIIDSVPKSLNKNNYELIEKKLSEICRETNTEQGELDLYLWSMKTGKIIK